MVYIKYVRASHKSYSEPLLHSDHHSPYIKSIKMHADAIYSSSSCNTTGVPSGDHSALKACYPLGGFSTARLLVVGTTMVINSRNCVNFSNEHAERALK